MTSLSGKLPAELYSLRPSLIDDIAASFGFLEEYGAPLPSQSKWGIPIRP
jgi:hypothetical protein